jgi:single-strand DNA-binding protein
MAGGINRVILVGRLARDVDFRKTSTGISMARFVVAVDRRYAGRDQQQADGTQQQKSDFLDCVAWRQRADFMNNYCRKGALVGVEGTLQKRNYTNNAGQKVYVTEVVADNVELLESKSVSQARAANEPASSFANSFGGGYETPVDSGTTTNSAYLANNENASGSDDFDTGLGTDLSSDDLPF